SLMRVIALEQRVSPPVLLQVGDLEPSGELGDWDGQLLPFSSRQLVLTPGVLLEGSGDELAQVIHAHYRDTSAAQGRNPDAEPSSRLWEALPDSYRHANRHQADHLWAKLAVTDCRAVPEDLVESFAFAPTEVERLAVIEHARWAADRYLDGWIYAPIRNNTQKHHPQLIPYADLSRPMKDLDRFAVRLVPALLARSGLGLVRMLIVGVPEIRSAAGTGTGISTLQHGVDQLVQRLIARYPDRGLIIAATLTDPASRLLARRALQLADAGLFLLCPVPIAEMLAAQPDANSRRELLALTVRAERRIALPVEGALERWLETRAEILVQFAERAVTPTSVAASDASGGKRVRVGLDGGLHWNFEY
ncbi:MAG: RyR domain-containing protein, partial [Thiohalocapsa sp.]